MAITGQFRKVAREKLQEFDPRKFLIPATEAMCLLCQDRFERFNTAGQASKIKVLSLATMAERYGNNELDPQIDANRVAAA
jgi:fructose-bisphosphate aldolase, class II